jgi:starch phosphorylase
MELLETNFFCKTEPGLFTPLTESIRSPHDNWLTAADFRSFIDAQKQVAQAYADKDRWLTLSILNTAASGFFSSDRTIKEYATEIWGLDQDTTATQLKLKSSQGRTT